MSTLYINSTDIKTELCNIGAKHNTDKSPFAEKSVCAAHRKGYTAFYSFLLSQYESTPFKLAEIGIEQSASLLTWSEKYPHAEICMFDLEDEKLNKGKQYNLPNTSFYKIDVGNTNSINESFDSCNKIFDIIIDDSSHLLSHQNNIIQCCYKYLKVGGVLVIEDIERVVPFETFAIDKSIWAFSTFVICDHANRQCTDNDKILFLVKR
jgi:hypothetical protein